MVRPTYFGFNAETAASNTHQHRPDSPLEDPGLRARACAEWDRLVERLRESGVVVLTVDDEPLPHAPDALFPNNWLSTHRDGTLVLYPMAVASRRVERRPQLIARVKRELAGHRIVDLTGFESEQKYLEGTGSLVLDRQNHIAYAARSVRTHDAVLAQFADALGYRMVVFDTVLRNGSPEYHTNVVMAVGDSVAVVCLDAIHGASAQRAVQESLANTGHQIIAITIEQMDSFAGNLLQLRSSSGERLWVMSSAAFAALAPAERQLLGSSGQLVHTPLPTIESVGGGSARCLMAELFSCSLPAPAL
jgi:hypothetical protein